MPVFFLMKQELFNWRSKMRVIHSEEIDQEDIIFLFQEHFYVWETFQSYLFTEENK